MLKNDVSYKDIGIILVFSYYKAYLFVLSLITLITTWTKIERN